MKINISENRIRRIVSETLNRFIIKESFTNMKQLYHGTTLDDLYNIIRVNSFFLLPSNHGGRGGKYYASLTRHKNNIEGFDPILYASEIKENDIESYAIITFNIPKLTRVHGISIRPFDYYGTKNDINGAYNSSYYYSNSDYGSNYYGYGQDDEDTDSMLDFDGYDGGYSNSYYDDGRPINTKMAYQKLKKPRELMSSEEFDSLYDYDDPEYYNMAEENIVSDTIKEIPEIFNYIDRIDVYFPADLIDISKEHNTDTEELEDMFYDEGYSRTYLFAHALCKFVIGTAWENKIVVNLVGNNAAKKPMSIGEFQEWLNQKEDYKTHASGANVMLNKKPQTRNKFHVYADYDEFDNGHN